MGSLEDCAELKEDVSHVLCCAACVSHLVDRATPRSSPKESLAFQGALCYLQQEGMGCQSGSAIVPCNENLEQAGLIEVLYLGDTSNKTWLIFREGMCERVSFGATGSMLSVYACLVLILISGLDNLIHLMSSPIKRTRVRMRTNVVIHSPTISHSHFPQQKSCSCSWFFLGGKMLSITTTKKQSSKL